MACLLLMRSPWLESLSVHSTSRSWPLVAWIFPWTFILYVLLPSRARPYFIVAYSFSNPFFASFTDLLALLPCHSVIPIVLLFNLRLLGLFWTCCMLNSSGPVLSLGWYSCYFLGFLDPFHCFWAPLAHLILLGILDSFPFLGHPLLWAFAKSFGLLRPKFPYPLLLRFMNFPSTPYSLNLLLRASLAHSCLLSISYNVHGFTTSFL